MVAPEEKAVPASAEHGHFVHFYDEPDQLVADVATFIDGALRAGGTGIVIASATRIAGLAPRLSGLGGTQAGTWYPGQLVFLDAKTTLEQFMVEGWPDAQRFESVVGGPVAQACARGGPVRAFGEMVALLCEEGHHEAAVALEELWNGLALRLRFSLFCGYPWRAFPGTAHAAAFQRICAAHHHVHACSNDIGINGRPDASAAMLEQRNRALEAEVARLRKSEHTLLRREKELTDFIENADEGLHRVGGDGTILWANRAELQMLGYRWDEYIGHHITEFHVDQPVIDDILARLQSGETLYDRPARLRCKDGSIKHVLVHSNGYFEDGNLRYTRCFTRDATARHQRDLVLAQRDRVLLHAPVPAALLTGPDFRFHLANRRFGELAGQDAFEGRTLAEVFPELRGSELMRLVERAYATGRSVMAEELAVVLGADAERFFKVGVEPLPGCEGQCDGLIVVLVDVTDHVHSRQGLERVQVERERLLADVNAASNAKDEFLAMLGHELRNPLSPIVTALQLMRMRGAGAALPERDIIQRQVDHLVRLVDDLLDVSRVTRGKIELKIENVQLQQPVGKAVEMARPLLDQRHHRLHVDVEPGLSWQGDPVRLAQVISNLLTNAARYTPAGGEVGLRAWREEGGWLAISVKDSGIGLSPEMLTTVFDLFVQGPRGLDRAEGGLGIGLALVKNIVELHGGTVQARSEGAGRGSEFIVRLPAQANVPATSTGAQPPARPGSSARRQRFLIVDDNADAAGTLGELLEALGHEVRVFHEPMAALDAAASYRPDVALLDIGLPEIDGYQLAARLRETLGKRACLMVALTGYGQDGDRERSASAGFEHHLVKPVSIEQLTALSGPRYP